MTLVAMVNLIVAYATLTWIPTKMIKHGDSDAAQGANISTLPSLSLTLVSLFLFQTLTGLVQAKLHSAYQTTAMNNSGKGRNQASLSLFAAFNTSVSIGAVGTLLCHVFAVLFGAGFV
ncbi:hypothetical protein BGZ54_002949 [Gamsiella multidivaricata]|nr:hypothetical protein BGZ54_002949 [Gamsiella multidivaricata]